jgi:putative SOS response-associated peptidase YedK
MPVEAMRRLFEVTPGNDHLGNQPQLPAIFPRHEIPVVRIGGDGDTELARIHWGFLTPQTSKKTSKPILPKALNNARDNKISSSPFWRTSFETRRCLIPCTSFCEAKGHKPATYFWFAVTGSEPRPPFAFAGLWRRFRGRYREEEPVALDTVTMVTTTSNAVVRPIHPDRMPVILDPSDYETWLEGDPDAAIDLAKPWPDDWLEIIREGLDEKADPAPV